MRPPRDLLTPFAFWLVFVATRIWLLVGSSVRLQADDLTRLAQVDAFRSGQGWWDLTMHQLGPAGVPMHWTRHVDTLFLLLGGGTEALRPVALVVLPLLLAFAVFVLVARIARELGGSEAVPAALLLLLASVLVHVQFVPGRIDHHGLQIVLVLVGLLGLLRLPSPRWALIAGGAIGVSLSIGLEQALVLAGLMVGVFFVVVGRSLDRVSGDRLAVGLVAGTLFGSLLFAPPSRLIGIACDVFSVQHMVVVILAAVGLVVSSRTKAPTATLLGIWGIAGAVGVGLAPRCMDPYADVAPLLAELWLPNVNEARGISAVYASQPGFALAVLVPAAVAIGWSVWQWRRGGRSSLWARITPALVLGFGAAFLQLRGASAATAVGVAVLGVALARLRTMLLKRPLLMRVSVMSLVALVISGLGPFVVGSSLADDAETRDEAAPSLGTCVEGLEEVDVAGVVLAPIDLGPRLLQLDGIRVLAGPYHRNGEGNLLAWELLGGEASFEALREAGVAWIATCEGMPERSLLESRFGPGLLGDLEDGDVPPFLTEVVTGAEGLHLYRVTG